MISVNSKQTIEEKYSQFFRLADAAQDCVNELLVQFNGKQAKLFDLPARQRIFLFILTRSVKTYSSIVVLCRLGYGQDVATLLRNLLENLVTAKYILSDSKNAQHLAERFVSYKWIIFKRALFEQELAIKSEPREKKQAFYKRKAMILKNVENFKKKFNVTSDRGLLNWSGKTVRDMAKQVGGNLLEEYDITFRQCSRFSHPSILGDQEYMIQNSKDLIFSSQPSTIGIMQNLKKAIQYFLEFSEIINEEFGLDNSHKINSLKGHVNELFLETDQKPLPIDSSSQKPVPIRECTVRFEIQDPR